MKWTLVVLAIVAQLLGCASTRMVPIAEGFSEQGQAGRKSLRIAGYTMADGTEHSFSGFVRPAAGGDQLVFKPLVKRPTESTPEAERSFTLPRQDVAKVEVREINKVRTAVLVGASSALVYIILVSGSRGRNVVN